MSASLDEVFDCLWNDWVLLGKLKEDNLSRIPEENTETSNLYKYKLVFIHLLCTILKAQKAFENGLCLDSVLIDFHAAQHSLIHLMQLSDTAAIYREQWESLSVTMQLQSVVVCYARGNNTKASALFEMHQLRRVTSGVSQDIQVSLNSGKISEKNLANRSKWPIFHAKLTRKLQFAYNLPRHHLHLQRQVTVVPEVSWELVRLNETEILVTFVRIMSGFGGKARGRTTPDTLECLKDVTKKIHEALKRAGIEGQQMETLMGAVLSTCQQRMRRILEENL